MAEYSKELVERVRQIYLETLQSRADEMISGRVGENTRVEPPINIVDTKPTTAFDLGMGLEHMYDSCGVDENDY